MKPKPFYRWMLVVAFGIGITGCESTGSQKATTDAGATTDVAAGEPTVEEVSSDSATPNKGQSKIQSKTAAPSPGLRETTTVAANTATPAAEAKAAEGEKPAEEKTAEKPAEEKAVAEKPSEEKPAAEKPAEGKVTAEKPATEKPSEEKTVVEKPAEEKAAAEKPAEEKPAAEKPKSETPAAETKTETPVATAKPETADSTYTGKVVLVNLEKKFVVVKFAGGDVPPVKSEMGVYRDNIFVGSVRIVEPVKPPLITGDILTGTLRRGDVVR